MRKHQHYHLPLWKQMTKKTTQVHEADQPLEAPMETNGKEILHIPEANQSSCLTSSNLELQSVIGPLIKEFRQEFKQEFKLLRETDSQ